ncbi:MAG: hypothetical protein C0481_04515 [Phenylobacterium sp.]|uniref:hypothetical protein n=1 Tax=Phenylobacterium sp. TaxID=1871053 RepID=UPI0025EEFDDF|nr:hypothetical protein [Phenylobacterium sp.]MBA4011110.1 hypothetical protein [Phenylobacterium sp.]
MSEGDLIIGFEAALTGKGHAIRGAGELSRFARYAVSRGHLICNVETYELRGNLEVPRIDLGLYQGSAEETKLSADERAGRSMLRLGEIIEDCEAEGAGFLFQVWIDCLAA